MRMIMMSEILVAPDRQRRVFAEDKLHELADGIATRGLLHPIILRLEGEGYALVAGERRLRAVADLAALGQTIRHDGQDVHLGAIPYTLFDDLDPLAAEEAELEENVHRADLSWQERAAAVARLTRLRAKQAVSRGESAPTVAEIALEVRGSAEGAYQENTRRELIVAKHLGNPAISAAKTVDEAFKILRKEETKEKNRSLGESVGRNFTSELHTLKNGNSLELMAGFAAESFDVILTDPPYGMGADEFGDSGGLAEGAHGYADTAEYFLQILDRLAPESFRLAKAQAHLYMFCDIDKFHFARQRFTEAGWSVFRTPLLWYKRHGMRAPWPLEGPQRKYECILYAVKGKRPVLKMAGDVLDYGADTNLGHAAQKPVALIQDLLSRSCLPGHSVLDPFCGTGPIFPAAHSLKVRATGIEMDTASFGIAVKRLDGLKEDAELEGLL